MIPRFFFFTALALVSAASNTSAARLRADNDYKVSIVAYKEQPDNLNIDYGYVFATDTSRHSYFIINTGTKQTLLRGAPPQFELKTTIGTGVDEFIVPGVFPLVTEPNKESELKISYQPEKNFVSFPAGRKDATMVMDVRGADNFDIVAGKVTFTITAVKCDKPLWSDSTNAYFGKVYVNPVQPRVVSWLVRNVQRGAVIPAQESLQNLTQPRDPTVFRLLNKPVAFAYSAASPYTINLEYSPVQPGEDIVEYSFPHWNPLIDSSRTNNDTMKIRLTGFGVTQRIELASALPPQAVIRGNGDTVDVGKLQVGSLTPLQLILRNKGNYSFRKTKATTFSDVTIDAAKQCSLTRDISPAGIEFDRFDTLSIDYTQQHAGTTITRLTIYSAIADSVFGVPETAKTVVLYIKSEGTKPKISLQSTLIEFDSVAIYKQCLPQERRSLVISNTGNFTADINSILVQPSTLPFTIVDKQVFSLQPGASDTIDILFAPQTTGDFDGKIVIGLSNDVGNPVSLSIHGKGVEPRTMPLRIPTGLSFFPGHKISIPLLIDKSLITLTSSFRATLAYDSSLLEYNSYTKLGTAAASSNSISIVESPRGTLNCTISLPRRFISEDTLLHIVFDTYLGYNESTALSFVEPIQFGTEGCASALPVNSIAGKVRIDSLCGLQYKLASPPKLLQLRQPSPNPVSDVLEIGYESSEDMPALLTVANAMGSVVEQRTLIAEKGRQHIRLPIGHLAEGFYIVELRAGTLQGVQSLVIAR